ncbi:hypothetical protein CAPTEDRAFT_187926 [Capitella teleta]|uniref:Apple domain-containing protein n=1 Tax=Capitella teleta TaxID=283909 RepID=R7U4R0_CAPTE|nr:hypothetical protein CAPTEDRAFT_187926 [Capitella teleta]|eukprot:ELU01101.1 hypothetical protein CAPTEDRAFT_187926 [Capitella teleta]
MEPSSEIPSHSRSALYLFNLHPEIIFIAVVKDLSHALIPNAALLPLRCLWYFARRSAWEFITHIDTCIYGFNDITLTGISVDECKEACENERTIFCRTAEWLPVSNSNPTSKCQLSKEWKDSLPSNIWQKPCSVNEEFIVFERVLIN